MVKADAKKAFVVVLAALAALYVGGMILAKLP